MEDSIFTKIIKGQIPCQKIYEDAKTFAFLDIHPVQPGHTLVIPRRQIEFVWDLPNDDYRAVMITAKKVARRLREVLGTSYVGQEIVGVDVPHAHVHLIPFSHVAEFHRVPDVSEEPDYAALDKLAQKLAF